MILLLSIRGEKPINLKPEHDGLLFFFFVAKMQYASIQENPQISLKSKHSHLFHPKVRH